MRYFVRKAPVLGWPSFKRLTDLNPINQVKYAIKDTKDAIKTAKKVSTNAASNALDVTKQAVNLAINSTTRAISNPLSVTNAYKTLKDTFSVTANALTTPVTSTVSTLTNSGGSSSSSSSSGDGLTDEQKRRAAAARAAAAASIAASKSATESAIKQQEARRKAEAEAAESAAKAAAEASAKQARNLERSRTINDLMKNGGNVYPGFNLLNQRGISAEEYSKLQEAANTATNAAAIEEQTQFLPEVQVKSDFTKYLLIGGVVLGAIYLLKGGRK